MKKTNQEPNLEVIKNTFRRMKELKDLSLCFLKKLVKKENIYDHEMSIIRSLQIVRIAPKCRAQ